MAPLAAARGLAARASIAGSLAPLPRGSGGARTLPAPFRSTSGSSRARAEALGAPRRAGRPAAAGAPRSRPRRVEAGAGLAASWGAGSPADRLRPWSPAARPPPPHPTASPIRLGPGRELPPPAALASPPPARPLPAASLGGRARRPPPAPPSPTLCRGSVGSRGKPRTCKAASKRFKITSTGKVLFRRTGVRHLNSKMTSARRRRLKGFRQAQACHLGHLRGLMPHAGIRKPTAKRVPPGGEVVRLRQSARRRLRLLGPSGGEPSDGGGAGRPAALTAAAPPPR